MISRVIVSQQKILWYFSKPLLIPSFSPLSEQPSRTLVARCYSTKEPIDLSQFPPERIRNFSIIAHIGKH